MLLPFTMQTNAWVLAPSISLGIWQIPMHTLSGLRTWKLKPTTDFHFGSNWLHGRGHYYFQTQIGKHFVHTGTDCEKQTEVNLEVVPLSGECALSVDSLAYCQKHSLGKDLLLQGKHKFGTWYSATCRCTCFKPKCNTVVSPETYSTRLRPKTPAT